MRNNFLLILLISLSSPLLANSQSNPNGGQYIQGDLNSSFKVQQQQALQLAANHEQQGANKPGHKGERSQRRHDKKADRNSQRHDRPGQRSERHRSNKGSGNKQHSKRRS